MEKQLNIEIGREVFQIFIKKDYYWAIKKMLADYITKPSINACKVGVFFLSHHQKFFWDPSELSKFKQYFFMIHERFPSTTQIEETVNVSLTLLQYLDPKEERISYIVSCINNPQTVIYSRVGYNFYFFDTITNTAFFFIKEEIQRSNKVINFLNQLIVRHSHVEVGIMNGLMFVLSHLLIHKGGLLLHGSAVQKDGETILFVGFSGAGKSTISYLCQPDVCFSDDGVIIRKEGNAIYAYKSPFRQIKKIRNMPQIMKGEIKKAFLLEKSYHVKVIPIKKSEFMNTMLMYLVHFFKYMNDETAGIGFSLVKEIIDILPVYKLQFAKRKNIWNDIC